MVSYSSLDGLTSSLATTATTRSRTAAGSAAALVIAQNLELRSNSVFSSKRHPNAGVAVAVAVYAKLETCHNNAVGALPTARSKRGRSA